MRNLTKDETERIVEAYIKNSKIPSDILLIPILRTALATVQLDHPKIDLDQVEQLVQIATMTEREEDIWRKAIGYTIKDLTP